MRAKKSIMSIFDFFTRRNRSSSIPVSPADQPIPEEEQQYYRPESYYQRGRLDGKPIVTFEQRKATAYPSKRGLYPAEILLLAYCEYGTYPNPKSGYPGFWWFEYGIRNVGAMLSSLKQRGFIQYVSAVQSLPRLTIPQLKELLSEFGLKAQGRKTDLIETLCANVSSEDLEMAVKERKYTLTPLGKIELEENAYIPYMHRQHKSGGDNPDDPTAFNVWVINRLLAKTNKSNWKAICDKREHERDSYWQVGTRELYGSLERSDSELANTLKAQDAQLESIKIAEVNYLKSGDIKSLIDFWEKLWKKEGLLFNGAHWTFRLADLYIEQHQYEEALKFVKSIHNPIYDYKVQKYVTRIEKMK